MIYPWNSHRWKSVIILQTPDGNSIKFGPLFFGLYGTKIGVKFLWMMRYCIGKNHLVTAIAI